MILVRSLPAALLIATGCGAAVPPAAPPVSAPARVASTWDSSPVLARVSAPEDAWEPPPLRVPPPAPPPPPAWLPFASEGPRSGALPSGFFNPLPGGQLAGYPADTGLDIAANRVPVYAIADAIVEYAEAGHTRWVGKHDSRYTVRLRLDQPVAWKDGKFITHAYYGHLSSLAQEVPTGHTPPRHVEAGQPLGVSGVANGSPHLHLGLILDGHVEQESWDFLLTEAQVRSALGVGANGRRLPRLPSEQ